MVLGIPHCKKHPYGKVSSFVFGNSLADCYLFTGICLGPIILIKKKQSYAKTSQSRHNNSRCQLINQTSISSINKRLPDPRSKLLMSTQSCLASTRSRKISGSFSTCRMHLNYWMPWKKMLSWPKTWFLYDSTWICLWRWDIPMRSYGCPFLWVCPFPKKWCWIPSSIFNLKMWFPKGEMKCQSSLPGSQLQEHVRTCDIIPWGSLLTAGFQPVN